PFRTIRRGIASLAGGDTLRIRAGTYDERLTNNSLILQGQDGTFIPNGSDDTHRTTLVGADGSGTVIIKPSVVNTARILALPNAGGPFQWMAFDGLIFDGTNVANLNITNNQSTQIIYLPGPFVQNMRFTNVTVRNGGRVQPDPVLGNGVIGVAQSG